MFWIGIGLLGLAGALASCSPKKEDIKDKTDISEKEIRTARYIASTLCLTVATVIFAQVFDHCLWITGVMGLLIGINLCVLFSDDIFRFGLKIGKRILRAYFRHKLKLN